MIGIRPESDRNLTGQNTAKNAVKCDENELKIADSAVKRSEKIPVYGV